MMPVLIARDRNGPSKYSMFVEGGLRPFGKCPIYKTGGVLVIKVFRLGLKNRVKSR